MKCPKDIAAKRAAGVTVFVVSVCVLLLSIASFGGESVSRTHASGEVWATQLAVGSQHSCAITGTGSVKCWGKNNYGQLGDNSTTNRTTPVDVCADASCATSLNGITALTAGLDFTCALTNAGRVKCWGKNSFGALGNNTQTEQHTPVDVCADADCNSALNGVTAISAGANFTCALMSSGGVKCWGHNTRGQLGDNTNTTRLTPVDVSGLFGVQSIAAGYVHVCAVQFSLMQCWGGNSQGELGDGTTTDHNLPQPVCADAGCTAGLSNIVAIEGGETYTCALTFGGGVKCWGNNAFGQLGDGTQTVRLTPVDVCADSACATRLTSGVAQIGAKWKHTCAVMNSGGAKCWGHNQNGKLGDGTTTNRYIPVDVSNLASGVGEIEPGQQHTCARMSKGAVKCWGDNAYGQLGNGTTTDSRAPVNVSGFANVPTTPTPTSVTPPPTPIPAGAMQIDAGYLHTCAVTTSGAAWCWGRNESGQLGDGTTTDRLIPVTVDGLSSGIAAISAGRTHTCALTTGGGVKCWGLNRYGALGDGTATDRLTPVNVTGLSSGIAAISAGYNHTCALTTGGGVKCWGWNEFGTLGDGSTTDRLTPVDVVGLSSGIAAISAAGRHTCALTTGGGIKCWGSNADGALGNPTIDLQSSVPVDVCLDSDCTAHLTSGVTSLSGDSFHTCAATTGNVKCWGLNISGEIGNTCWKLCRFFLPVDVPNSAGLSPVGAGFFLSAALTPSGGVKYWGNFHFTPTDISNWTSGITVSAVGGGHICALATNGAVSCFGDNYYGQLGDGKSGNQWVDTPVQVVGLNGGSSPPTPTPSPTPDCSAAPAKPVLSAPANNSSTSNLHPTLRWNAANCAETYKVTVKDTATGNTVDKATGLTRLRYRTDTLTANKTYKWFVHACHTHGCTKSAVWTFTEQ